MRSASELLSKWLGETEQQIASMFAEAEAEGALLFLDEADSFLRDRGLARGRRLALRHGCREEGARTHRRPQRASTSRRTARP